MKFEIEVVRTRTQPITETCFLTIEAEDREEAEDIALDCATKHPAKDYDDSPEDDDDSPEDFDGVITMSWGDFSEEDTEEEFEIEKCEEVQ